MLGDAKKARKKLNWKPKSTGKGRFGNWLENLIPDAKIKIAHSKIDGKNLEKIMLEFIENKFVVQNYHT